IHGADPDEWHANAKRDVLALAQFIREHNVRPLGVEVCLASDEMGVAGTIDLPCKMTVMQDGDWGEVYKSGPRKGETKITKAPVEVTAIVDFKSGMKGFWESHEIQLHLYRR